jgi:serine/threonine protein kinase
MLESSLLTPGNVLGNRYEITQELGRGGFGRTYLAVDRNKFGEKCVLKEFAPQVKGPDQLQKAKELFEREAGVLYKLKHPQIPAFRELLRVDGGQTESLFLIQDYVNGDTYLDLLNQRLKQGKVFSESEVVQFLADLLPILEYIHSLGVIHRDISPDNIIYRQSDRLPVLIDFGGVKEVAATAVSRYSNTKVATRIGKQGYAPDEQMIRGTVSPASDLYAVATTALTLLIGKEASAIYSPADANWEWRKYINLSPELSTIFDRLLQYNPQHRYQSAREVLALLPTITPTTPEPTSAPTNSTPITHANHISQLKTLAVSPGQATAASPQTAAPARDPNEWKKPALQVTKVMSAIFVACLGISAVAKWVQALAGPLGTRIDPAKMVADQFNSTKQQIEKAIPNPLKSLPSVQQRQQDLNQRLQQQHIPVAKFYRQVDRAFHANHPELQGRALTSSPEDNQLRQEWQDLAVQLLAQWNRTEGRG